MTLFKKQNTAKANVVDGKLILSFPNALNPVVWQMDLNEAKSSALTVIESENHKGAHTLALKSSAGKITDIAPFEQREAALDGLKIVANALENAHGQIRPMTNSNNHSGYAPHHAPRKRKWLNIVLVIVGLFVLLNVWAVMSGPSTTNQYGSVQSTTAGAESQSDASEAGVPVSADAFLRGR